MNNNDEKMIKITIEPPNGNNLQTLFKIQHTPLEGDDEVQLIEEFLIEEYVRNYHNKHSVRAKFMVKDVKNAAAKIHTFNSLFGRKNHGHQDHMNIFFATDRTIQLAPKGSKELQSGYVNRAIFLHHIGKFEDCIKDCRRGFKMDNLDPSRKLFFAYYICQCYSELKLPIPEEDRKEIMKGIDAMYKEKGFQKNVIMLDWIKYYLLLPNVPKGRRKKKPIVKFKESDKKVKLNFEPHKKFPCASNCLEIIDKGEREVYVEASRDIEAGEILAVEKRLNCFVDWSINSWLECTFCRRICWSRIPCEHCSGELYCSENCREEDWKISHQWLCQNVPESLYSGKEILKFFFYLVHESGGIDNFVDCFHEDKLKKEPPGDDFDYTSIKNYYRMLSKGEKQQESIFSESVLDLICHTAYYIATRTDFLGKKFNKNANILLENRVMFLCAAMARSFTICRKFLFRFNEYYPGVQLDNNKSWSAHPFGRCFRHSCNPNTFFFTSKNHELVVISKYPIKKGEKITVSYVGDTYFDDENRVRTKELLSRFSLNCTCEACKNKWTHYNVKTLKTVLKNNPELHKEVVGYYKPTVLKLQEFWKSGRGIPYSYIEKIRDVLKMFKNKSLVHTMDYEICIKFLQIAYIAYFGNKSEKVMPYKCHRIDDVA